MNTRILLSIACMLLVCQLFAQDDTYQMKANAEETTIDFLSSYYQQDGDNAAVTGGIGTEKLTDIASVLVVNVPLDSINSVSVTVGADFYSSASTDNIDNNASSASSKDLRTYGVVSYSRKNLKKGETYSVKINGSTEYDYNSVALGVSYAKEFNEGNSELNLNAQVFRDQWTLYLPSELRDRATVPTTSRNSYNLQATFSQVLNKRMQFSLSAEVIYMQGLLSTPFHRVYFSDQTVPDIERLPDNRLKIPIGIRFNYFPSDLLVLRSYYRFYLDDWGLRSHTFSLETPLKISPALTISPFYRYHTQSAVDHFAPYAKHTTSEQFYTSDYDLSKLNSHKVGMGFKVSPLYGLGRFKWLKGKIFQFKALEVRAAYYKRSTNLDAFIASLNLSFGIK